MKQIVPFVLLRNIKGDYLCYKRSAPGRKLQNKFSMGIRGNILSTDEEEIKSITESRNLQALIMKEIHRIIRKEAGIESNLHDIETSTIFLGIIDVEDDKGGEGHLGLVFEYHLSPHTDLSLKEELNNSCWLPRSTCSDNILEFELWSKRAMELAESTESVYK